MAEAPRPGSPDPADGPPAALPDGDTLRELIMTKEKELHDINEYRIVQLEGEISKYKEACDRLIEERQTSGKAIVAVGRFLERAWSLGFWGYLGKARNLLGSLELS